MLDGFDDDAADFAFAALIRRHAAIGEDEAAHAGRREVIDEVLDPGKVGVAARGLKRLMSLVVLTLRAPVGRPCRFTPLPARVVVPAEPVGVIEGRIGEDEVGAQIGMGFRAGRCRPVLRRDRLRWPEAFGFIMARRRVVALHVAARLPSAVSALLRLSAASQSFASKLILAELFDVLLDLGRAMKARKIGKLARWEARSAVDGRRS